MTTNNQVTANSAPADPAGAELAGPGRLAKGWLVNLAVAEWMIRRART